MNNFEIFFYFICFGIIAGGSFAIMWSNIQSINKMMDEPIKRKHPEAPEAGEKVMYVDVSTMNSKQFSDQKERLEQLYNADHHD